MLTPKPNWFLKILYGTLTVVFLIVMIVTMNFWWIFAALFTLFATGSDASNDYV